MDPLEQQGNLERQGHLELLDSLGIMDLLGTRALRVNLVPLELLDSLDLGVLMESKVNPVHQEQQEHEVQQDKQDLLVLMEL